MPEYQQHIHKLLAEHGIFVTYKQGGSPRAYRKERRVVLKPIRGISSYYVALHEIGHVVGDNPPRRLEQEVAAWRWALDAAMWEPTPGAKKMIHRCLNSYVKRAERWASMKLPEPGHDFWKLLEESAQ